MKIENATIEKVNVGLDITNRFYVQMIIFIEYHESIVSRSIVFQLLNPVEVKNFIKIMKLTDVQDVKDLEGKVVRTAFYEDCPVAIGHPVEDRFVDVTNTMIDSVEELTQSKLFEDYPE